MIKDIISQLKSDRVVAIDQSTTKIAFAVLDFDGKSVIVQHYGCIDLKQYSDMWTKMTVTNAFVRALLITYQSNRLIVEQPIMIQNPQTTRYLSYIAAAVIMAGLDEKANVQDVPPITWKSFIGYKNVTKKEIAAWTKEMGETEAKKKAAYERKYRVKLILEDRIPGLKIDDHDVMDAIGIGVWGLSQ